jgi:hypothetical protein
LTFRQTSNKSNLFDYLSRHAIKFTRSPPAFARRVIIAKDRPQPYFRLPEQILHQQLEFVPYSIFSSRFSTYSNPAIAGKKGKATVSNAPLENMVAKKIKYIDKSNDCNPKRQHN